MPNMILMLGFVPVMVLFAFSVQWASLSGIHSSAERLPVCRDSYLGYSFLLFSFAWVLFFLYGVNIRFAFLLPVGATFAIAGDYYNLQFEGARHSMRGESVFGGIIFFTMVQLCYALAFLARVSVETLTRSGFLVPLLVAFLLLPLALFFSRVWNKERPRRIMFAFFAYDLVLGLMVAVAVSSAIAYGGPWYLVAAGAVSYVVSDSLIGVTTINGRHPISEFQTPWLAYLIGQGLIQYGYALLLL